MGQTYRMSPGEIFWSGDVSNSRVTGLIRYGLFTYCVYSTGVKDSHHDN